MAQLVSNTPLIERNARIGRIVTTGSLIIVIAPLAFSLPVLFSGARDLPPEQLFFLYGALLLGLVLSNVGGYFLNRWGIKYFEQIAAALKGTDKRYRFYNYSLPVPNALLTPFGVTVLLLKNLEGRIYVTPKGWRMNVGILRFLRWFSSEQLGDPSKDLQTQMDQMNTFIQEHLGANFKAPIDGLIVFTNPRANVEITNVELPVVMLNQDADALKNALKRTKGAPQLSKANYDALYTLFEQEAAARRVQAERGFVVAGRKIF